MLRLACVLLYQGRFKSRRSGGSRISLRVRSILVTFCIYFCSSYIILVLCATLCSFSTSNSLVFAFSQFACVCMFVCVLCIEQGEAFQTCVDTRTCVPAFFVLQYVTINFWILRIHTDMYRCRFLHVALVLVVVLLLETMVLVVLVFVLVLVVLLVLVGVVVALLVGWILVPRSHLVRLPRSHPDIIAIKLGFYSTVLVSVPRLHCKAALLSMKALFFLCPTMQIGLVQAKFQQYQYRVLLLSVPRVHCKVLQKSGAGHCFFLLLTMQIGLI